VRIITNVQERDQPITKDDKNYCYASTGQAMLSQLHFLTD